MLPQSVSSSPPLNNQASSPLLQTNGATRRKPQTLNNFKTL
jgi:hypothetical protein